MLYSIEQQYCTHSILQVVPAYSRLFQIVPGGSSLFINLLWTYYNCFFSLWPLKLPQPSSLTHASHINRRQDFFMARLTDRLKVHLPKDLFLLKFPGFWLFKVASFVFFKISLQFGTSNCRSICGKLNLLPINSIYLVFYSQEMKRRPVQNKVCCKLFYPVWKETSHKHLKVAAAKKSFPSLYIIDTICFDECFLFHVITGRH